VDAADAVPGGFAPDDVERIVVHVAGRDTWDILVDPPSRKADPDQLAAEDAVPLAQFSLPFMVACGVLRRGLTVADLSPQARADPLLHELIRRTEVVVTDSVRGVAQLPEPGYVELHPKDGRSSVARSDRVLGHPAMPMSDDQVAEKFRANAHVLPVPRAERIATMVLDLEDLDDVRAVTAQTAP
jgi:2-methylcitrate dehydratase PrpD